MMAPLSKYETNRTQLVSAFPDILYHNVIKEPVRYSVGVDFEQRWPAFNLSRQRQIFPRGTTSNPVLYHIEI
jgi:hypothetical protein